MRHALTFLGEKLPIFPVKVPIVPVKVPIESKVTYIHVIQLTPQVLQWQITSSVTLTFNLS